MPIVSLPKRLAQPRLLACDIDGTLLDASGDLRATVRAAVSAIVDSGVEVVLATGRSPWGGIRELASRLRLTGPQITMQGALISDPATGRIDRLEPLPPSLYFEAVLFADELGLDPIVAFLDGHRAERLVHDIDTLFPAPRSAGSRFRLVSDLSRLAGDGPLRVFLPTGPERHRRVRVAAPERFGRLASIVWSDLSGLEILAPGTHKGSALAWLAARRGIGLDEVAAVGDAWNDLEMLQVAGRSAAMRTAPLEVRQAASVVVADSDSDGCLEAFATFFPDLAPTFDALGSGYGIVQPVA